MTCVTVSEWWQGVQLVVNTEGQQQLLNNQSVNRQVHEQKYSKCQRNVLAKDLWSPYTGIREVYLINL